MVIKIDAHLRQWQCFLLTVLWGTSHYPIIVGGCANWCKLWGEEFKCPCWHQPIDRSTNQWKEVKGSRRDFAYNRMATDKCMCVHAERFSVCWGWGGGVRRGEGGRRREMGDRRRGHKPGSHQISFSVAGNFERKFVRKESLVLGSTANNHL